MRSLLISGQKVARIGLAPCFGPEGADESITASFFIPGSCTMIVATNALNIYAWASTGASKSHGSLEPPTPFTELAWDVSLGPGGMQPLLSANCRIVALDYSIEEDQLTVVCTTGELVAIYSVSSPDTSGSGPEVEVVGSFDSGLLHAAWSPDGEFLALTTGNGMAVFMTKGLEIIAEHAVPSSDSGPCVGASVCWRGDGRYVAVLVQGEGSQVHAKVYERGSFAPFSTVEPLVVEGSVLTAHWQPNGRHLYVAAHAPDAVLSTLKSRTAAGLASAREVAGEAEDGQGEASTSGADYVSAVGRARVTLVETNGLHHGEVELRSPLGSLAGSVEALCWSPGSDMLAVSCVRGDGREGRVLQVWVRNNWHWYLKHERVYEACEGALHISWDSERPMCLHVVTAAGHVTQSDLFSDVLSTSSGTVAVADQACVRVTSLGAALVPPPMCHVRLTAPNHGGFTAVCLRDYDTTAGVSECVAAVTSRGEVVLAACPDEDLWEEVTEGARGTAMYDDTASLPLQPLTFRDGTHVLSDPSVSGRAVKQLAWAGASSLVVLYGPSEDTPHDALLQLHVRCEGGRWAETARHVITLQGTMTRVIAGGRGALLMDSRGRVLEFDHATAALHELYQLPSTCCVLRATHDVSTPLMALSDATQRLYLGPMLVASDATSAALRLGGAGGAFLMYVNRENQLRSVPLPSLMDRISRRHVSLSEPVFAPASKVHTGTQGVAWTEIHANVQEAARVAMRPDAAMVDGRNAVTRDNLLRPVELGAQVVVAPPNGVQAVLQMPRGNLEGVSPRAVVLSAVLETLRAGDWHAAWELGTVNRLDLNLLVDFGFPSFITQVDGFVESFSAASDLADFILMLNDADTTATDGGLYGSFPSMQTASLSHREACEVSDAIVQDADKAGKVTAVCTALRAAMQRADPSKFTFAILNTYLKSSPCMLGEALMAVKALKESELGGHVRPSAPTAEAALRHLLIHVDVDRLYRAALEEYDIPLAYMVIASSQRDPAEYLHELKSYATIPSEPYRRYTIDMALERYPIALQNLVAHVESGNASARFDEVIELAATRGLFREALDMYTDASKVERRRLLLNAYGANLEGRHMLEDAAMAYTAATNFEAALRCHAGAGAWQMALFCAGKLGYDANRIRTLARDLVNQLHSLAQYEAAGHVYLQYLDDADNGVALLSRAGEWREALRYSVKLARPDLIPTVIEPMVAEASASLLEEVKGNRERIDKYITRWKEVRRRRHDIAVALANAEVGDNEFSRAVDPTDREDAQSDAFSNVTGLSIYTTGTGVGGSSMASTSQAPSTIGGRGKVRAARKAAKKKNRIQVGSVQEELQLVQHIRSLAPQERHLSAAGRLCEALLSLGHESDAHVVQVQLSRYIDEYDAAETSMRAEAEAESRRISEAIRTYQQAQEAGNPSVPLPATLTLSPALQLAASPGHKDQITAVSWKFDILREPKKQL